MESANPYQAPASNVAQPGTASKQTLQQIFFSFEGRVPRKVLWLYLTLPLMVGSLMFQWLDIMLGTVPVLSLVIMLASLWPSLAVQVKRWHDRDKSGWWMLISLIPVIGAIWAFVEIGCLRGTPGANRFGAEPEGY